jgi:hypothetical protein
MGCRRAKFEWSGRKPQPFPFGEKRKAVIQLGSENGSFVRHLGYRRFVQRKSTFHPFPTSDVPLRTTASGQEPSSTACFANVSLGPEAPFRKAELKVETGLAGP